jgi:hypothetical protein
MVASLGVSQLWDIRQSVRMLAEDIVGIRYQEATSENIRFICAAVTVIFIECVNQSGCYSYL